MSLSKALLERATDAREISVGIANGDRELTLAGYRRQSPAWIITERGEDRVEFSTAVVFGPFGRSVRYDRAVLYLDDQLVRELRLDGVADIPANFALSHEIVLEVTERGG